MAQPAEQILNSNDIEYKLQPLKSIWGRAGDAPAVNWAARIMP